LAIYHLKNPKLVINGILYVLRTGFPCRDLRERFGKWTTVYNRFSRWTKAGIWNKIFQSLLEKANHQKKINWQSNQIDSTSIRVHQHAGLAYNQAAIGKSRGGKTT